MKVVLIANAGRVGGGNRSLLTLAEGLRTGGVEPVICCPDDGDMADLSRGHGFRCEVTTYGQPEWRHPVEGWRGVSRWVALLNRSGAEVVHANSLDAFRSVSLAAWHRRLPAVCHVRYPPRPDGVRWVSRGLPKPSVCVFNSHALLAQTDELFREACPETRLEVVHNAVDLEAFAPRGPHLPGPVRVGVVANLLPVKGLFDFLEMAAQLIDRQLPARFLIVGQDVLKSGFETDVRARSTALGLDRYVTFTGYVEDVPPLLRTLDIVVSAAHEEPFGRSLLEAMACQVPVVATRIGGHPEVVADGVTGVLVPPHDPPALAEAVWSLAVDHERRQRLGVAGRRRAMELFGVPAHAGRIIEIYESLTRRHPGLEAPAPPDRAATRHGG